MQIEELLTKLNQRHILEIYRRLSEAEKKDLKDQLLSFGYEKLKDQLDSFLSSKKKGKIEFFEPVEDCEYFNKKKYSKIGEECLRKGQVATVILAGGMASRLKWGHPKGTFPITLVKKKSMFQLTCEKLLAAQEKYKKTEFLLSIMTSSKNNEETLSFFEKNNFFGLKKDQIDFFIQDDTPFFDDEGKWFFSEDRKKILTGPNGNGGVFESLKKSKLLEKFQKKNIKYLTIIPVDNPLADPFDEVFIGFHEKKGSDVSLIVIEKEEGPEIMGVMAREDDFSKIKIIEYIHLTDEEKKVYKYLNTSIFCMSIDFLKKLKKIKKTEEENINFFPYHHVKKSVRIFHKKEKKLLYKSEKFIFDILDCTSNTNIICYPRKTCYAPLKNYSGRDSLVDVQEALYRRDREVFFNISKKELTSKKKFELSPKFYYPTPDLLDKWKGRSLPDGTYIEP